jgi:hypothetical protein
MTLRRQICICLHRRRRLRLLMALLRSKESGFVERMLKPFKKMDLTTGQ